MDTQRCCLFDRVSAKFSKIKLKQVYATKNTSMHSRASEPQKIWTDLDHGQLYQNAKRLYGRPTPQAVPKMFR
jgi:hypothetical protein